MKHSAKWKKRKFNAKMLFEDILADAETINKELTSDELDMISDLYTKHTGGKMNFKKSLLKNVKVNAICEKFGDKSCVKSCRKKIKSHSTLKSLAKKFIMKPSYPKDVLAAACAKMHYVENIEDWEKSFHVQLEHNVPGTGKIYNSYCTPE